MVKLDKIDESRVILEKLSEKHIGEAHALWINQYEQVFDQYSYLPKEWKSHDCVERFIKSRVGREDSVAAIYEGSVAGYMTFDVFDFHDERTAFSPIIIRSVWNPTMNGSSGPFLQQYFMNSR